MPCYTELSSVLSTSAGSTKAPSLKRLIEYLEGLRFPAQAMGLFTSFGPSRIELGSPSFLVDSQRQYDVLVSCGL
jgi:hypothetical protein